MAQGPAHNGPGFLRPGTLSGPERPALCTRPPTAGARAQLTKATLPASSSSVSLRRALKLLTMSRTPLPVSPCGNQNTHPAAGPRAPAQRAGPEGRGHLGGPGLAVHAVHGLGAGVDGVGELLLHVPVGLRDLPDAGEGANTAPVRAEGRRCSGTSWARKFRVCPEGPQGPGLASTERPRPSFPDKR